MSTSDSFEGEKWQDGKPVDTEFPDEFPVITPEERIASLGILYRLLDAHEQHEYVVVEKVTDPESPEA